MGRVPHEWKCAVIPLALLDSLKSVEWLSDLCWQKRSEFIHLSQVYSEIPFRSKIWKVACGFWMRGWVSSRWLWRSHPKDSSLLPWSPIILLKSRPWRYELFHFECMGWRKLKARFRESLSISTSQWGLCPLSGAYSQISGLKEFLKEGRKGAWKAQKL